MTELLQTVLEAYGGIERWNQLASVSARLIQGGAFWALKGQPGLLEDVVVTANLHEERASHRPFGAPDRYSAFAPPAPDYDVEISGGATGAHYITDYVEVSGIKVPTKHRIFARRGRRDRQGAHHDGKELNHMNAATQHGKTRSLADGNSIPLLGLGVWQVPNGPECVNAVRWALELGYRHIDTAQAYGNEESVGQALRDSGIAREELFITTKFYPARKDPVAEVERSLQRLGLDYVDLYIIHWPQGGPTWAWPGMEQARERGYARSIGVSNFDAGELLHLLRAASVPPAVNQVQFSPYAYRKALLDTCQENGIALEAYSPLGTGRHLSSDAVRRIAENLGRTPAQVLLRWCIERDIPVIPKSTHRERIAENSQLFDFALSNEDLAQLDQLDRTGGTDRALEQKWW